MAKVKVFFKEVQTARSRGQKLRYHMKGFVTRNKHVQYENSFTSGKKVMANVKVVNAYNADADADADTRAMTLPPGKFVPAR